MNVGKRIKQRREALGMTQEELALSVGYTSKTTITKIEKGVNDVSQSKLIELAKVLRTTPSYLLGDDENFNYNDKIVDFIFKNGTSATITSNDSKFIESMQIWEKEVGMQDFTKDELYELINFAKFVLSKRK